MYIQKQHKKRVQKYNWSSNLLKMNIEIIKLSLIIIIVLIAVININITICPGNYITFPNRQPKPRKSPSGAINPLWQFYSVYGLSLPATIFTGQDSLTGLYRLNLKSYEIHHFSYILALYFAFHPFSVPQTQRE